MATAQVDTPQFDLSTAVPETDDGKAISALPAFDLNSAVPEDTLQNARPQDNLPEAETKAILNPSPISQFVRGFIKNVGKGGLEQMKEADYAFQNAQNIPTKQEGESDQDFEKRIGEFEKPLDKAEVAKGVMGQLGDSFNVAIAAAAPEMSPKAWATLGTFMMADQTRQAVQNIFLPNLNPTAKDVIDLASFPIEGGLSHEAVTGIGNMISKAFMIKGVSPTIDLEPEALKQNEGSEALDKLGISQNHIDASTASGLPVRVPISKVLRLTPEEIGKISTDESGLETPKTTEEQPQAENRISTQGEESQQNDFGQLLQSSKQAGQERTPQELNSEILGDNDLTTLTKQNIPEVQKEELLQGQKNNDLTAPLESLSSKESIPQKEFGAKNKFFTKEMANAAREAFNSKMSGLHSGIDPTALADLTKIGGFYVEGGLREFGGWSKKMVDEFGESIRPHLQNIWDEVNKDLPKQSEQEKEPKEDNKYVKNEPFMPTEGDTDKNMAKGLREEFTGQKNSQIVRGNQLSDDIKKLVPNKTEREGLFWYKAANGNVDLLAEALNDDKFKDYHGQIEKALNLSTNSIKALDMVNQYYHEAGQVSQDVGTINNIRDNYMNRIYKPEPPQDFVKSEMKSGIKQTTSHAKQRVYDTEFEAVANGKKFATTDISDALSVHNEELARVNTSRKLADYMQENGLGAWKKEKPDGWEQVGNLRKKSPIKDKEGNAVIGDDGNQVISSSSFFAPKGIADGLRAITEPDLIKRIDSLNKIQKYQGLVKTVDLSYSFFHHISLAAQTLYQGGPMNLAKSIMADKLMDTEEFKRLEQDFTAHTGITAKVESNQDIMRELITKNPQTFTEKITNLPVIKQGLQGAQNMSNILFGRIQRYMKVMDYGNKISNWIANHPEATNAEIKRAKLGFSKEINSAYGGLNWEAMGMTKTSLSLLRLVLLAPDWTISNLSLGKMAFEGGTAGSSARWNLATALVWGMLLTEGINHILTGHFTDQNKKGHPLEIQVAPDTYVSLLRGGIGDIVKLASMNVENGPIAGTARFMQGKMAPVSRTSIGLLSGVKYTGAPIQSKRKENALQKTVDYLAYTWQNAGPQPFGMSNLVDYMQHERQKSLGAEVMIGTGVARYSKSGKRK